MLISSAGSQQSHYWISVENVKLKPLAAPSAYALILKVLIRCQQADSSRQEGDDQGNETNTYHLSVAVNLKSGLVKKKKKKGLEGAPR